jgi:hypothetical protein
VEKPVLTAISLRNAVLCADCEMVSDSTHDVCGVCGSRSLLSLSVVLGGPLPAQRTQLLQIPVQDTIAITSLRPRARRRHSPRRKSAA